MLRSRYDLAAFHDGWRRRFSCRAAKWREIAAAVFCLMLTFSTVSAHARSPLSLPPQKVEQASPVTADKPIAPAPERGQLLYENHCMSCHTSVVHVRSRHSARSMEELARWTRRWAAELRLPWGAGEIDEVARYLERRYYKFGEPEHPAKEGRPASSSN